jgi:hypothetical protein
MIFSAPAFSGVSPYRPEMSIVWDIREGNIQNISSIDLQALASYYRKKTSEQDQKS